MENSWLRRGGFGLLVFVFLVSVSCDDYSLEHRRMIEACEKVRIGDTEQVVRELMGEPLKVKDKSDNLGKGRTLDYWAPAIVASGPQIHLDESGHVDETTCYESHHLKKDQSNPHQNLPPSIR